MLLEASLLGTDNGHFMPQKPKATRLQKSSLKTQPNPASTSPSESGGCCGSSQQLARPSMQNSPSSQAVLPSQEPADHQPQGCLANHTRFSQQASDKRRMYVEPCLIECPLKTHFKIEMLSQTVEAIKMQNTSLGKTESKLHLNFQNNTQVLSTGQAPR